MQFMVPNYHLRRRQFLTKYICADLYERLERNMKEFDIISFTTDIWNEPSSKVSLLSLTAHGINEDFKS